MKNTKKQPAKNALNVKTEKVRILSEKQASSVAGGLTMHETQGSG